MAAAKSGRPPIETEKIEYATRKHEQETYKVDMMKIMNSTSFQIVFHDPPFHVPDVLLSWCRARQKQPRKVEAKFVRLRESPIPMLYNPFYSSLFNICIGIYMPLQFR